MPNPIDLLILIANINPNPHPSLFRLSSLLLQYGLNKFFNVTSFIPLPVSLIRNFKYGTQLMLSLLITSVIDPLKVNLNEFEMILINIRFNLS